MTPQHRYKVRDYLVNKVEHFEAQEASKWLGWVVLQH